MGIKRAHAQADRKCVVLIAQLLEPLEAALPECAELHFGTIAVDVVYVFTRHQGASKVLRHEVSVL